MVRWEKNAGTALFHRAGREVTLTSDGRLLADAARSALDSLEPVVDAIVNSPEPSALAIGFLGSLGPSVVGELVASFSAIRPGTFITQREGGASELLDGLSSGRLDVAVVAPPPESPFGWLPLGVQNISLIVPAHHRFASLGSIDLAMASEEDHLALSPHCDCRTLADSLCEEAGFAPHIVLEANSVQSVRDYVASGLGIAILPSDTSSDPRVAVVPIRSPRATRAFGISWHTPHRASPLAREFRDHAREVGTKYPRWADLLDH
jgi:DNA-binding transcriptional LysR family regulator